MVEPAQHRYRAGAHEREASMPSLYQPLRIPMEFKRRTCDLLLGPQMAVWHEKDPSMFRRAPAARHMGRHKHWAAAARRPGSAVSSDRSDGCCNQWHHHGGEQKPALASARYRLFPARLQERTTTTLQRQPYLATGDAAL